MKTQKEIAKFLGISQQYLSFILNGERTPSWKTAKRLALLTNTDPVIWIDGRIKEIKAALQEGA